MNLENETSADADEALDLLDNLESDGAVDVSDDDFADEDEPRANTDQVDDEDADDNDPDKGGESDAAASDDKAEKPKSRAQKRFDKLTREKNDARREVEFERQQREALQRNFDQLNAQVQHLQPTREQIEYGQRQGLNETQVQNLVQQQASALVEQERFSATVSGLEDTLRNNGAEEALTRLSNPALTNFEPDAINALSEAKFPARVANAIAGNEKVFSQFSKLKSGVERARFIDRLDGRFESREASKKVSADVAKPTPRVRGSSRRPEKDPDEMDQAEYEVYARKQGWLD